MIFGQISIGIASILFEAGLQSSLIGLHRGSMEHQFLLMKSE